MIGMAQNRTSMCVNDQPRTPAPRVGLMSELLCTFGTSTMPGTLVRPDPARLGTGAIRTTATSPLLGNARAVPKISGSPKK